MVSSQKIITFCICAILLSFGVLVEGGQGDKDGGGHGALETLLAAGLLAKILRKGGGGGGHGGYGHGRAAYSDSEMYTSPRMYGGYGQGRAAYPDPQMYADSRQYGSSHTYAESRMFPMYQQYSMRYRHGY